MNHSAKGDFKSSLPNSSEDGFLVRKWSSFRFRGPFCKWRGFIIIVSAPSYGPNSNILANFSLIGNQEFY
jgi:hypothetical protein